MAERTLIGIDVGTSSCKAVMLAADGTHLGSSSVPYEPAYPRAGWAEQDPEIWHSAAVMAVRDLLATPTCQDTEPMALGVTGQMISTVFVGDDGLPVCPSILWLDQRSEPQARALVESHGPLISQRTMTPVNTAYALPRLLWLRDECPALFKRVHKLLLAKDYVRLRLTGTYATDFSDASGMLLLDSERRVWSEDILQLVNVEPEILPSLLPSHEVAGHLTSRAAHRLGLEVGLPVVTGAGDLFCENVAAGNTEVNTRLVRFGSCGSVSSPLHSPVLDPDAHCPCYVHCIPDRWLFETSSQAFGLADAWFRKTFSLPHDRTTVGESSAYQQLDEEVAHVPPGADGLLFRPFIQGAPYWDPALRGAFVGITIGHRRAHFARAVLEGACFALLDAVELMESVIGEDRQAADMVWKAVGGGTRSLVWPKILADMLGADLVILEDAAPAKGAAMLAALGVGAFSRVDQVVEAWASGERSVEYDPEGYDIYNSVRPRYSIAHQHLSELDHREQFSERRLRQGAASGDSEW